MCRKIFLGGVVFSALLTVLLVFGWRMSFRRTDAFVMGGQVISQPRSWYSGNIQYFEGFETSNGLIVAETDGMLLVGSCRCDPRPHPHFSHWPAEPIEVLEWSAITGDNSPNRLGDKRNPVRQASDRFKSSDELEPCRLALVSDFDLRSGARAFYFPVPAKKGIARHMPDLRI